MKKIYSGFAHPTTGEVIYLIKKKYYTETVVYEEVVMPLCITDPRDYNCINCAYAGTKNCVRLGK